MIESPRIAHELRERAYRRPNGELAWRPADAVAATEALAAAGYAVLGGEWWVVLPDGTVQPWVPATEGEPSGIYAWSVQTVWVPEREGWETYCERAAAYTIAVLLGEEPGSAPLPAVEAAVRQERPDLWPHVWYCLAFVGRDQYEAIRPGAS
jgi:hypothetical protein